MHSTEHFGGFFQPEPDYAEHGIWVTDSFSFPLVLRTRETVTIEGFYYADLLEKQSGNPATAIIVRCGHRSLLESTLSKNGAFTLRFSLEEPLPLSASSITISASQAYVPAEIGKGSDHRRLAWRVRKIETSGGQAFDFARCPELLSTRHFSPKVSAAQAQYPESPRVLAFYYPIKREPARRGAQSDAGNRDWATINGALTNMSGAVCTRVPVDHGFYDFRAPGVLRNQIELAKQHGIAGFCFAYDLTDEVIPQIDPASILWRDTSIDFRYCIFLKAAQIGRVSTESLERRIDLLKMLMDDPRYFTVDERPVVVIKYANAERIAAAGLEALQDMFRRKMGAQSPVFWQAHSASSEALSDQTSMRVVVCDTAETYAPLPAETLQMTAASPSFKPHHLAFRFAQALGIASKPPREDPVIFVDAWNDWACGRHLEADQKWGYGKLAAIATVLRNQLGNQHTKLVADINCKFVKRHDAVIILHVFYEDLIDELFDTYLSALNNTCDLMVTCNYGVSREAILRIQSKFSNCFFHIAENRGRDIRPFGFAYKTALSLQYRYGCKLHTKKSPHATHGASSRQDSFHSLVNSPSTVSRLLAEFSCLPNFMLAAPASSVRTTSESTDLWELNTAWLDVLLSTAKRDDLVGNYSMSFPAGSMYWFDVNALKPVFDGTLYQAAEFELEAGQLDGTLAHALERVVGVDWATNKQVKPTALALETENTGHIALAVWENESQN
jgi:Rhamnan synthesis protein F/Glycosyltransferase WbsX